MTLLPRAGLPEDIAAVAVFLASDDSNWVTGVALPADGQRAIPGATSAQDVSVRAPVK
jgi:NAD(P)-dependent dehydrogenase (short-subunit alcohol dehydrogenase family)